MGINIKVTVNERKRDGQLIEFEDEFDFGQYGQDGQRWTVGQVITDDPKYVSWCIRSIDGFKLGEAEATALEENLRKASEDEEKYGRRSY